MSAKEKNRQWVESFRNQFGSYQECTALIEVDGKTVQGSIHSINLDDELLISYGYLGGALARFKLKDRDLQERVKIIRRVLPDRVVARYLELDWKPIQDYFYDEIGGKPCGCGLAVMVGENLDTDVSDYARALGLEYEYASGFTRGFDGEAVYADPDSPRMIGYQDGCDAWEAVKREVLDDAD